MKTKRWASLLIIAAMIFAIAIPTFAVDEETATHRILYAGQDMAVGFVDVSNDLSNLYVVYQLNTDAIAAGLRIIETHLAVEKTEPELPQNKSGNPQVGHFEFSENHDPGVENYTVTIPLGNWAIGQQLVIAAHAVVQKVTRFSDPPVLLATENNHPVAGDTTMAANIYKITTTGVTTLIDNDLTPVRGASTDNFNGNAYDAANNRFYFSDYGKFGGPYYMGPSPLYFNDMAGNTTFAGTLIGGASGGTFFEGAYYYIAERTSTLRRVTFNPDGTVLADSILVADIFPLNGNTLAFGDIDIRDEAGVDVIYGSATELPSGLVVFFSMNLDGLGYTIIKSGALYGAGGTQISFGSDGVLYGVNARTPFSLFSINTTDGSTSPIATLPVALADLASGPAIPDDIIETETAWANGTPFVTSGNWAMYFNYTVQGPVLIQTLTVPSSNSTGIASNILTSGEHYRIEVSGTWRFVNWATIAIPELGLADAGYSYRIPNVYALNTVNAWVNGDDLTSGYAGYLELQIDNQNINWGTFNPDHVYTIDVTGAGAPLNFRILDNVYGDNVGSLTVKIYQLP